MKALPYIISYCIIWTIKSVYAYNKYISIYEICVSEMCNTFIYI